MTDLQLERHEFKDFFLGAILVHFYHRWHYTVAQVASLHSAVGGNLKKLSKLGQKAIRGIKTISYNFHEDIGCLEKLLLRVGGSGTDFRTTDESIEEPEFVHQDREGKGGVSVTLEKNVVE